VNRHDQKTVMTALTPDREQVETFVNALFKHAGTEGYASIRSFPDDATIKPFSIKSVFLEGGLKSVVDIAVNEAANAANAIPKIVFCPPISVFKGTRGSWQAREQDILRGLALSVECDERAQAARLRLEKMLGPATIVTLSGGQWTDPATGELHPKLHLHWRLKTPAEGKAQLVNLKKARVLATEMVGGDASNKPIVHPIRWPGSWHRKGEPVLSCIETANLDCEIDLDAAIKALTAASGNGHDKPQGRGTSDNKHDWMTPDNELIADIKSGKVYYGSLLALSARWNGRGETREETIKFLERLMHESIGPRDDRWKARVALIPSLVDSAQQKKEKGAWAGKIDLEASIAAGHGSAQKPETVVGNLLQSSAEFVRAFVPPDYLIDGLLQRRFLYSFTGSTGAGKTSVVMRIAAHVALGQPLTKYTVEQGRVLFFAGENPDDVRMRWIKLCEEMKADPDNMDVCFLPGTPAIGNDEIRTKINAEVAASGGPIALVIVDTSAAYFKGDDENSRTQLGNHARMLRTFVNLPGGPTVIVTCHPTKAPNVDNLLPAGGGSFLNEVDGNLVCSPVVAGALIDLHWHGKFRGPDFEAIAFKIQAGTTEKLKDSKGRSISTVTAAPISDAERSVIDDARRTNEVKLLALLNREPRLSLTGLAEKLGWFYKTGAPNKSLVNRMLAGLRKDKLIEKDNALTPSGRRLAEKAEAM